MRIRKDKKGWEMDGHVEDVDVVRSMEEREWLGAHLWRTLPFSRPTAGNFPVVAGEGTLVRFDGMVERESEQRKWSGPKRRRRPCPSNPPPE